MSGAPRTVAVTGAGGTLGLAIARRLAAEPSTALMLSDIDQSALERALEELEPLPATAMGVQADVSDQQAVERLVDEAVGRFDGLHVMINNAGSLSPNARMHNLSPEDWTHAFRVNLMGTVHGIVAAVRVMRPQGGGAIVNTGSIAGITAWAYAAPYGAMKAAVIQLTKVAAAEYARDKIRVNCVCPGSFSSPLFDSLPDEAIEAAVAKHPLGMGAADDIAGAFAYLASEEARWTTGSTIVVDGGYTAL